MKISTAFWVALVMMILGGCYVSTRPGPKTKEVHTREVHHTPPQKEVVVVEKPAPAPEPQTYRAHSTTVKVGAAFRVFGDFDAKLRITDVTFRFTGVSKWITASHVSRKEVRVDVPRGAKTGKVELAIRGSVVWVIRIIIAPDDEPEPAPISYRLEPTQGAVGDTITLHGKYAEPLSVKTYRFKFEGAANAVKAESVTPTAVTVKVPKKASTGELVAKQNGKAIWRGTFTVVKPPKPQIKVDRLEPTVGPVGTTVTLYGKFPDDLKPKDVQFSFNGPKRLFPAKSVDPKAISIVVPPATITGPVTVLVNKDEIWRGTFRVTPDNTIIKPTPGGKGLRGEVWKLPANTQKLPDFASLGAPFATITVPNLNVAPRPFETGFPGLGENQEALVEWFAIRFSGKIKIPSDGDWGFQVTSDDGVKLYIDGKQVLANDGIHPPKDAQETVNLTKGTHDIVVEYFQGPRVMIALQLRWRSQGKNDKQKWQVIPASAFVRD